MNNALTKTLTAGLVHGIVCEILDYQRDYVGNQFDTIVGIHQWSKEGHWCLLTEGGAKPSFNRVKPLLFPMSSLTKDIEFKSERFVPTQDIPFIRMWWKDSHFEFLKSIGENEISSSPFRVVEWLIEHHFNVFNLSPEEFIEVNETNNPYKV